MRLVIIADGRSPITRNWIQMLQPLGHEIHLVSTFSCSPVPGTDSIHLLPVAFSRYSGSQAGNSTGNKPPGVVARFRGAAATLRHLLGPWTVVSKVGTYRKLIKSLKPDLVHAMRIPFEGMLASHTPVGIPLVISTWGNDFSLHAPSTKAMSRFTRLSLQRADGLITDILRDVKSAQSWGYDPARPSITVPGNGGLDLEAIEKVTRGIIPAQPAQVINPRGIRSYIREDTFFKAIPLVLKKNPGVKFICASMAGQPKALDWLKQLNISENVTLMRMVPQTELWKEFARSAVSASISTHDGTPNSLLEAMAIGCLPICGDLESIREWIKPGENGLLVDPADPLELAEALMTALTDTNLRAKAAVVNRKIIESRADREQVREKVANFYSGLNK